jgi:hypothetical protein|eukprot:10347-Heterococcus_DN1.PRE.1
MSTMKTSVLLSSIFFMADSVVKGYLITLYLSSFVKLGTALRTYFGVRASLRVLGLQRTAVAVV